MVNFFSAMIHVTTILSMAATGIFYIGILFKSSSFTNPEVFSVCNNQIKICRVSIVIFSLLYWFVVSGLPSSECLIRYQNLSAICSRLGSAWIIFAFLNIVISIILGIQKRGADEIATMSKLRNSSFIMGAILLMFAFVLTVN